MKKEFLISGTENELTVEVNKRSIVVTDRTRKLTVTQEKNYYEHICDTNISTLGTIVLTPNHDHIADEIFEPSDFDSLEDARKKLVESDEDVFWLPVYKYENEGLDIFVLNTTGFPCHLDSKQIGWIYMEKQYFLKRFNKKHISEEMEEMIYNVLANQIADISSWLNGEVFNYTYEIEEETERYEEWRDGFIGKYELLDELLEIVGNDNHDLVDAVRNYFIEYYF